MGYYCWWLGTQRRWIPALSGISFGAEGSGTRLNAFLKSLGSLRFDWQGSGQCWVRPWACWFTFEFPRKGFSCQGAWIEWTSALEVIGPNQWFPCALSTAELICSCFFSQLLRWTVICTLYSLDCVLLVGLTQSSTMRSPPMPVSPVGPSICCGANTSAWWGQEPAFRLVSLAFSDAAAEVIGGFDLWILETRFVWLRLDLTSLFGLYFYNILEWYLGFWLDHSWTPAPSAELQQTISSNYSSPSSIFYLPSFRNSNSSFLPLIL